VSAPAVVRGPLLGQGAACEVVLRALPDWFGIEESIRQYVKDVDELPAFVAVEAVAAPQTAAGAAEPAERVVGLLAVATCSAQAAEIHVMAVLQERQRQGTGRALLAAAETWLRAQGVANFTVKTLSAAHPDPSYAATRAFYAAMGFVPLMELPTLWGAENPCLVALKTL
jgi:GNAT superfamily N-acetyltransferase